MKPEVSVIMSVFNEPVEWISQSINSILNQIFTDFEFIIVNDNPNGYKQLKLLKEFALKDQRIKILENSENLGLPKSLNRAINISHGKYIARMDADDISLPSRLQQQMDYMNTHPEVGVCGTSAKIIDGNGTIKQRVKMQYTPKDLKDAIYFFCPFIHPSVMIRRELLLENLYDEKCRVAQDWNLWLRLSDKTKFANLKEVLLYYRIHDNQSQKKAGRERSRDSRIYSDGIFADHLNLSDKLRDIWIRSRNDNPVSISELNELYHYLIESQLTRGAKKYAINAYIRKISNFEKRKIIRAKLIWKYPFITIESLFFEIKRIIE